MSFCIPCQKLKETAKKAIQSAKYVSSGYSNLLLPTEEIEKLSEERMKVCNECPFKTVLAKIGKVEVYKCGACNCPLLAATRSPNYPCPKGKW